MSLTKHLDPNRWLLTRIKRASPTDWISRERPLKYYNWSSTRVPPDHFPMGTTTITTNFNVSSSGLTYTRTGTREPFAEA